MVQDAILLINRTAGMGQQDGKCTVLASALSDALGGIRVELALVDNHRSARDRTTAFLRAARGPAVVVAGGGGGTLRAVVEGICGGRPIGTLPGPGEVRLGVLRMGSGNVLAKRLGVPKDPRAAITLLAENLRRDRTVPVTVMRCETDMGLSANPFHAVTMGGFGQFGRTPGTLDRWHRRWPHLRRVVARRLGVERLNSAEYFTVSIARCAAALARRTLCEVVEVSHRGVRDSFRLLAGVLISYPVPGLPFRPAPSLGAPTLSLSLVPRAGRTRQMTITCDAPVQIRLLDRTCVEFFLDEDPEVCEGQMTIRVAGTLAFVPCREVPEP